MNILGIDSSGLVASVALQSDDKLVGEYTIHNKKTHSQTLLPMIHDMLEMADVSVKELDAIAIASGPGSFTGLRIGAATAKGLGGALSIPLIAVPTLEGLLTILRVRRRWPAQLWMQEGSRRIMASMMCRKKCR